MSGASPETTVLAGPLRAANATVWEYGAMARATRVSSANTAAIAPEGIDCISRPRTAISCRPSSSSKTPATHAATYSPTLCPSTKLGLTPQERHSSASDHSSAKIAGCARLVCSSCCRTVASSQAGGKAAPGASAPGVAQKQVAAIERGAEYRLSVVKLPAHSHVLRALPCEHERNPRRVLALALCDLKPRRGLAVRVCLKRRARLLAALGRCNQPGFAVSAAGIGREGNVAKRGVGMLAQIAVKALRQLAQGRLAPRRERQQMQRAIDLRTGRQGRRRCLFQNDVGIGAAESKRAGSRDPRSAQRLPGHVLGCHLHRQLGPGNERVRRPKMQVCGDLAVLERNDHLEQSGHPGGGFQVAQVCLHRADQERPFDGPARARTAPRAWTSIGSPSRVPVPWAST